MFKAPTQKINECLAGNETMQKQRKRSLQMKKKNKKNLD